MGYIRAVAFDVDGTLVNSDRFHWRVFNAILKQNGMPILTWKRYVDGGFIQKLAPEFFKERVESLQLGSNRRIPKVNELLRQRSALVRKEERIKPYALYSYTDAITKFLKQQGYPLIHVTGASKADIEKYFKRHPSVKIRFVVPAVTANDGLPGKPDPAPYVEGRKRLSSLLGVVLLGNQVMAVEDAAKGVRSAKAAGMFVVGVSNTTDPQTLYKNGADIVVRTLSPKLFEKIMQAKLADDLKYDRLIHKLKDVSLVIRR